MEEKVDKCLVLRMEELAQVIKGMKADKVPPPAAYSGQREENIEDFLVEFEKYVRAIYKDDKSSWVQILPSFLDGEAREIVKAFGRNSVYEEVKKKLVKEFTFKTDLARNEFSRFFSAVRSKDESLVCYSIRLERLADKVGASLDSKECMIRSKFVSGLPTKVVQQLKMQLGHKDEVSLGELVRLATILEESEIEKASLEVRVVREKSVFKGAQGEVENRPKELVGVDREWRREARGPVVEKRRCFICDEEGHLAQDCRWKKRGNEGNNFRRREICSFCNEVGHRMQHCEAFQKRFMACAWCGLSSHQSHECARKPKAGN